MKYWLCFPIKRRKGEIFADLNQKDFCFELPLYFPPLLREDPLPPPPHPWQQLGALATIAELTAILPEKLPMRDELRSLAIRALETAVADLGDDVRLHQHGGPQSATGG